MTVAQQERRVQRLEDIEDIRRVRFAAGRLIDEGVNFGRAAVPQAFAACYAEDAVWSCAQFGTFRGRDEILAFFGDYCRRVSFCLHYAMNPEIEVARNRRSATARWHAWEPMTVNGEALILAGQYHDTYERSDQGWHFKRVTLEVGFLVPYLRGWAKDRIAPEWAW